jgi:hypothetical protein
MFKWQKAMDRHSPRLKPNHSSDPPHFSLLSTFNIIYQRDRPARIDRPKSGIINYRPKLGRPSPFVFEFFFLIMNI